MNKSDLVDALASKTGMTKADAARAIDALFSSDGGIIASALKARTRIQITGFGTFQLRKRKKREGRNPQTGESIQIPASKFPAFSAGRALKDRVRK